MFVVLCLEWIETEDRERELTQISALRVDENWEGSERFDSIILPKSYSPGNNEHIAFTGYDHSEISNADNESSVLEAFSKWLQPDDVLCVWDKTARSTFLEAWSRSLERPCLTLITCANLKTYQTIQWFPEDFAVPDELLAILKIEVVEPRHCAKNDVVTTQRLYRCIKPSQKKLKHEAVKDTLWQDPDYRSAAIMAKVPYEYVFTHDSKVFHTKSCRCMHHVQSIEGTVYYSTAAKNRRPCKVCNPQPKAEPVQETAIGTLGFEKDGIQYKKNDGPDFSEIIKVRLLDGSVIETRRGNIVGVCRNMIHPGKMTKGILKQHDCLMKQCPYLTKYEEVPFWRELEQKKQKKSETRKLKKARRADKLAESERKVELKERFQGYANLAGANLDVIRVECPNSRTYIIYYVSDNPYGDGAEFSGYKDFIRERHPNCLVALRHIKNLDGSFVTRDEFYAVKRK